MSQIVTFGTMAAKAVVRDVGRVLGHGYGMVDGIAKLVPNDLGIKLKDALEQEEMLQERYDNEEDVRMLIDLALKLEGTVRNTGKHAGGVVIGPKPLDHFCPILCEPDGSSVVTQLDKTMWKPQAWSNSTFWACERSPSLIGRCTLSMMANNPAMTALSTLRASRWTIPKHST